MPFVAAGAVVLGVITAMGVGIGVLAVKAMDFGKAFEKAKSMLMTFVGVVTNTFDAVKAAMMSGDYATAVRLCGSVFGWRFGKVRPVPWTHLVGFGERPH